jgi:putative phosphoesterase
MGIKIGVISDTHLREVTRELEDIYERYLSDKDLILHAGDIVSGRIVHLFNGKEFHGVHGNMDPREVREMLPGKKIIDLGSLKIGLIHGWGASAGLEGRIRREFHEVDAIVYGHSHHPANFVRDGVLFFNPGTATGFSSSGINSIGILELGDTIQGEIVRVTE